MTHPPRSGLKMLSRRGGCSLPALAPMSTVAGGRKGILATYTLPLPWGPQWGQVSRDNRCHHSGKPAPGEALISPHLHSHSNRKQDSHCLIGRGWAPTTPAQGSARMTGHSAPLSPRELAEAEAGYPVQQSDKWQDRWPERHTWMSDMQTPSRPAGLSRVTAGCSMGVKVHQAVVEPLWFPEVMDRLSSSRKCACLLQTPHPRLPITSQFPQLLSRKPN